MTDFAAHASRTFRLSYCKKDTDVLQIILEQLEKLYWSWQRLPMDRTFSGQYFASPTTSAGNSCCFNMFRSVYNAARRAFFIGWNNDGA